MLSVLSVLMLSTFASTLGASVKAHPMTRIGGTPTPAVDALHACMLLVIRDDHDEGRGALGGGSIVTRNRVITAAHVVRDAIEVQVGFYVNSIVAANLRRVDAIFVQSFTYDEATLLNDIAVLQFRGNAFPVANVIAIAAAATPTGAATLASYGYTAPDSTRPSMVPLLAEHTIAATCAEELKATETHFCALATAPSVVCPGDGGSGLYAGATLAERRLIGVVSTMIEGCVTAAETAFTNLGEPTIALFLESQGITAPAA